MCPSIRVHGADKSRGRRQNGLCLPPLIGYAFLYSLQMKELSHENINVFIGATIDGPHICTISAYCPKGSLQVRQSHRRQNSLAFLPESKWGQVKEVLDHVTSLYRWILIYMLRHSSTYLLHRIILENDDIRLDLTFKYSLTSDLANVSCVYCEATQWSVFDIDV